VNDDHPSWCRCKRCEAEDREQERAALKGVPVQEPEPPPMSAVDRYMLDGTPIEPVIEPSDHKREVAEKRMRDAEPGERAALGYFP
jgi:hypothetical protein